MDDRKLPPSKLIGPIKHALENPMPPMTKLPHIKIMVHEEPYEGKYVGAFPICVNPRYVIGWHPVGEVTAIYIDRVPNPINARGCYYFMGSCAEFAERLMGAK